MNRPRRTCYPQGMTPDARNAKRAALIVGLLVISLMAAFFYFFAPPMTEHKGVGIRLILEKQEQWRRELVRESRHINELEAWQIQEELARRTGISRSGVKGLVQRACHAKDEPLRSQAQLLNGQNKEAGTRLFGLGKQAAASKTAEVQAQAAVYYQLAADAAWRDGEDAEAAYEAALGVIEASKQPERAAEVLLDRALYHWSRALFHPENPSAELQQTINAATQAATLLPASRHPLEWAAAMRLLGNATLRKALLPVEGSDLPGSDRDQITQAVTALRASAEHIDKAKHSRLWAAVLHDLGMAALEWGKSDEKKASDAFREALAAFDDALSIRTGRLADGETDVAKLGGLLSQRAESLAGRAAALAVLASSGGDLAASPQTTRKAANEALQGCTPDDPGPAWIMARHAEEAACALSAVATTANADQRKEAIESGFDAAVLLLDHYPLELVGTPGVPSRIEVLTPLMSLAQSATTHPQPGVFGKHLQEVEQRLRKWRDQMDRESQHTAFQVATAALVSILVAEASNPQIDLARKAALVTEALKLRRQAEGAGIEKGPDVTSLLEIKSPDRSPRDPFKIPWQPDRVWREQMARMNELLRRLNP